MKKFLLLLLVLTVCLSAFIGCSDFDNKNTESDDEGNFNAQNTEQVSNFPKGAVPAAPCFAGLMETALFAGLLSAPSQAAPPGGTVA